MNTSNLDTNLDSLTLAQLDTATGGSLWSGIKHVAGDVAKSAKVVGQDMVNGAAVGAAGGGIVGAVAGLAPGAGAGAALGGAAGGVFGIGYGIGHEIGGYIKK